MPSDIIRDLFAKRDQARTDFEYVAETYRSAEGEPPEDWTAEYDTRKAALEAVDERLLEVHKEEQREAQIAEARKAAGLLLSPGDGVVHDEPRTYGPGTDNSWCADMCWRAMPGDSHYDSAVERLQRYGKEVIRDSVNDPKMRDRVVKAAREHYRRDDVMGRRFIDDVRSRALEVRAAMDTTSGSGGSFVTPQYLVPDWAEWRQFGREFANASNLLPLPDYGMTVYLPAVQGPAGVASQSSQNSGIDEAVPTAGYLSASLTTEAGEVPVSQQLLDRAGPGVEFDLVVFNQLKINYAKSFDSAVLTVALANAGSVSDTSTGSTGADIIQDLYSDVAQATQQMETTDGTILSPTHVFSTPTQWSFISSQLDTNGRPLVVPGYAGPFNAIAASLAGKENVVPEGDTGYELLSLSVFKDGNIPTANSGADTQILVAHMPEVWVWEGELVPRTIPQTLAQNLTVLLQVYSYNAVIVRYPLAVQAITGARYPVSPTFTRA